jgi:hypothetical protein
MTYKADPGERNRLVVKVVGYDHVLFQDSGATIRATRGMCRRIDRRTARCDIWDQGIYVRVGDRDDVAVAHDFNGFIVAGGGADYVVGGVGGEIVSGGAGADSLLGRRGGDILEGGRGRDVVVGGRGGDSFEEGRRASTDRYDGGRGMDGVDYYPRKADFALDLSAQPLLAGPERDVVTDVERFVTGPGNDRLLGDHGANVLESNGGRNYLDGRGGSDYLATDGGDNVVLGRRGRDNIYPGSGDRVRGGRGKDMITTVVGDIPLSRERRRNDPARIACGPARDYVQVAPWDVVTGCERAQGWDGELTMKVRPRITNGGASFTVRCQVRRCAGDLLLARAKDPDDELGSVEFDVRRTRADPTRVTVPLMESARTAIMRGSRIRVHALRAPSADIYGARLSLGYTARLQAP